MLVDAINHRKASEATESTVLGPFHMVESPPRELGDSIDLVATGQPCVVTGRVVSLDGGPLAGAQVDVWQADDHGFYDVQQPGAQPRATAGACSPATRGRFWFRTVTPSAYPIPTDGPSAGSSWPAAATPTAPPTSTSSSPPPATSVTTHVFVAGGQYLDSDAVFAVKQSLVRDFTEVDDPPRRPATGSRSPSATPISRSCSSRRGNLGPPAGGGS